MVERGKREVEVDREREREGEGEGEGRGEEKELFVYVYYYVYEIRRRKNVVEVNKVDGRQELSEEAFFLGFGEGDAFEMNFLDSEKS